ncbi:hypothetical protein AGLY_005228 [Aphis glycines]|uniref:ISXO2-like transposase domain-containing protein n=1 Tax=Aphis glycines TaxID=307491 RepID=A0A6G0TXF7_APHGL|nr:hypothetical protein AGLY_005228 [Aphis glycines]
MALDTFGNSSSSCTISKLSRPVGRSKNTVVDWFNLCRDVAIYEFDKRSKLGGKDVIVQIDESLFKGKRKYNRGRLRCGDIRPNEVNENDSDDSDDTEEDNNSNNTVRAKNYGTRVSGPWVFGLSCKKNDILERRLFIVEKRDKATLLPIIKNEVELGSIIHSDEYRAYSSLNNEGYMHSTVNHQKWFIDPDTNANNQTIECVWKIVKKRYEIRVNGASPLLPRQLKEEW